MITIPIIVKLEESSVKGHMWRGENSTIYLLLTTTIRLRERETQGSVSVVDFLDGIGVCGCADVQAQVVLVSGADDGFSGASHRVFETGVYDVLQVAVSIYYSLESRGMDSPSRWLQRS